MDASCVQNWQPFDGVAVTAVAVSLSMLNINGVNGHLVAVGSEEGKIQLWWLSAPLDVVQKLYEVPLPFCHGKTIRRLLWRQQNQHANTTIFELASCGEDNSVRFHHFQF